MPKRFIDTCYFKSPFIRGLKAPLKLLYTLIICECDGSGIWIKDLELAELLTGTKITDIDFNIFIENGKAIDIGSGKYFFPDFIEHQYPQGLQGNNPAHKNFINQLKKYNLIDENNQIIKGASKPLESPFEGSKVKVKDKVKVKVKVKDGEKSKIELPHKSEKFKELWEQLLKEKKWRKKSESAILTNLNKLARMDERNAIISIENAIGGEWQGIYPPSDTKHQPNKNNGSNAKFNGIDYTQPL